MTRRQSPSNQFSAIPRWPEHERPRERLLEHGAEALSDAELLAILIRTGTRKRTAVDLARTLLAEVETLNTLASRSIEDLRQKLGITKAAAIVAAFELGRRSAASHDVPKQGVHSPEDIARRYIPLMH